jgi:hypothetical protein
VVSLEDAVVVAVVVVAVVVVVDCGWAWGVGEVVVVWSLRIGSGLMSFGSNWLSLRLANRSNPNDSQWTYHVSS